ncbi:MAG: hypothetical protein LBR98_01180 [Syntrophomonadaceae bacterium]|jgi:ABC-type transport system involved in multi-copper enzyme maturation permease subunit|nr:hypothetical protein [Syntrophomonadaceae bacterium]
MKLFKYEMKKLLLNRNRLILLAVMFVIFTLMSLLTSSVVFEMRGSGDYREYLALVAEHSGTLNHEQLAESKQISEAARASHEAEYGKDQNDLFNAYLFRNPVMKFHHDYANFGERVHEYWNGSEPRDKSDIRGVYPLEEKLETLKYQQDSYEYRYYQKRLETELSQGEPVFADKQFWSNFFAAFDITRVVFLFLIMLAFFMAPVFTRETENDMNGIILCSLKGRREIVTAKLLSVCSTIAVLTTMYFAGNFIGAFAVNGNIAGFDAPARCLEAFRETAIGTTVGGMAFIGILWTTFAALVFGLFVCLISAYAKSRTSVFGLSIVFILTFSMMGFLPDGIHSMIWPLIDFNFVTLSLCGIIFGGSTMYNFLGMPLSYGMAAFIVCIALSAITILLTYLAQMKRSVT